MRDLLIYNAMKILPDLIDEHPTAFLPLIVRLTTSLVDKDNEAHQATRAKAMRSALARFTSNPGADQTEPVEDPDWPLEDDSDFWSAASGHDDKKKLFTLVEHSVGQWVRRGEKEKVQFAIEMLSLRRLAVFPTILIHCLRQDVATWQEVLLDLLTNETIYRRKSCWYEIREALKVVLPHASDRWITRWIGIVESARQRNKEVGKHLDRLQFFACCPEERLPQGIRKELSDARADGRSLENQPAFSRSTAFVRDSFEVDLETIDDESQRDMLRLLRGFDRKSLNQPLAESDAAKANQGVSEILSGRFEIKQKGTGESEIFETMREIEPYNIALGLAAHLMRENQADEVVKQHALLGVISGAYAFVKREEIAWESLRKLYQTAIAYIDSQELDSAVFWITSPLENSERSAIFFNELLPILKALAVKSTGKMLARFSEHLKLHLQRSPVACLEILDIVTSQDARQLTDDWDNSTEGIDSTADILKRLDPFVVPKAHRERLRTCIERLAGLGVSTAQEHLLDFVL